MLSQLKLSSMIFQYNHAMMTFSATVKLISDGTALQELFLIQSLLIWSSTVFSRFGDLTLITLSASVKIVSRTSYIIFHKSNNLTMMKLSVLVKLTATCWSTQRVPKVHIWWTQSYLYGNIRTCISLKSENYLGFQRLAFSK